MAVSQTVVDKTGTLPTTAGEIIFTTTGGIWIRLAAGTAGQVLQSNGVASPTWVTPASSTPAVIFDGGATTKNVRTDRPANQSSIDNTVDGVNNFGSDTVGTNGIGASEYSAILGGDQAKIGGASDLSTICGGEANSVGDTSPGNSIGGGGSNSVADGSALNTIAGGENNTVGNSGGGVVADHAAICGGQGNKISSIGFTQFAFIGGGEANLVDGDHAVIGSGSGNKITGRFGAILGGLNGAAIRFGQEAFAPSMLSTPGDMQWSRYQVFGTDSTGGGVALTSAFGTDQFVLEDGHAYIVKATCIANRQGAAGRAAFVHTLLVHASAGAAVIDSDNTDLSIPNGTAYAIAYTAVGANIVATFTGTAAQTVAALVSFEFSELGGGA